MNSGGFIFTNRRGMPLYQVEAILVFISKVSGMFVAPAGFITDMASVPRLPFIYFLLNGIADMPGVLHDYLYSTGMHNRKLCDDIFLEAMLSIGVSKWKAYVIYSGVRLFGGGYYNTVV